MTEEFTEVIIDAATNELDVVRDLARKAYGDAIPELIDGQNVTEIMRSVEGARAAYSRVIAEVEAKRDETRTAPPVVPAGGSVPRVIDMDRLPASEKLRLGVGAVRR